MGDLLLATNLIQRPIIKTGGAQGTPAWKNGSGTNATANSRDEWGTNKEGLFVGADNKPYAPLGQHAAGGTMYLSLRLKPEGATFKGGDLQCALVRTLGDAATTGTSATVTMVAGGLPQVVTGEIPVPAGSGELFLLLNNLSAMTVFVTEARLSPEPITDEFGRFSGAETDTETIRFDWAGEPELSWSQAWGIGQAPDPEPEPEPAVWGDLIADYLDRSGDEDTIKLAGKHAPLVLEYVRGYTRGRGFTQDEAGAETVTPGIRAVVIAATARLTANPEQVTYYQTGDYTERPAILAGWTLPELAVLNNYRKRWA